MLAIGSCLILLVQQDIQAWLRAGTLLAIGALAYWLGTRVGTTVQRAAT
jgi:hypothetical protein